MLTTWVLPPEVLYRILEGFNGAKTKNGTAYFRYPSYAQCHYYYSVYVKLQGSGGLIPVCFPLDWEIVCFSVWFWLGVCNFSVLFIYRILKANHDREKAKQEKKKMKQEKKKQWQSKEILTSNLGLLLTSNLGLLENKLIVYLFMIRNYITSTSVCIKISALDSLYSLEDKLPSQVKSQKGRNVKSSACLHIFLILEFYLYTPCT